MLRLYHYPQVKIIVPNTTAGLVIGKSGATVKTIMDESGTKVKTLKNALQISKRYASLKYRPNLCNSAKKADRTYLAYSYDLLLFLIQFRRTLLVYSGV